MNNVAKLSTKERAELFAETGARKGMVPAVVEKDFWACWALSRLFNTESISKKILFNALIHGDYKIEEQSVSLS